MKHAEAARLRQANEGKAPWRKWGPYVSERQWGTVREDYSASGDAWSYLTHDQARSKAYRWGEDGIAGICDEDQTLCLGLAFWNGQDPILKERFFGLTGKEGNHGEDVKEIYYYLDSTPTHSYMKMLYKYPQRPFPYARLLDENRRRSREEPEFELLDTGIFDDDRYFDIFVEYAKAAPEEILIQATICNRGAGAATLHVLPQVWFRNSWSWGRDPYKPALSDGERNRVRIEHRALGLRQLEFEGDPELLYCENETNVEPLAGRDQDRGFFKDGIDRYVVHGEQHAVNPERQGTKAALHYVLTVPAGGETSIRLIFGPRRGAGQRNRREKGNGRKHAEGPFDRFNRVLRLRRKEADEFYGELQQGMTDADARNVQRQALAGMLWSKQFYYYDIPQWLNGDPGQAPPPPERKHGRNSEWQHLNTANVLSMPDKWEFPWFAAWDLAFHCIPLSLVDPEFAKEQLVLLTREWYMHPNGQLPAYEWSFGDVNPPVHAWAAWRVYEIDRKRRGGKGDTDFLERVFHKLLLNFTWWVNRKDIRGRNIFQGGFLGLDNIGVFDRDQALPNGASIEQADGTSWMAMYSLTLMRIALELALAQPIYQDLATKFFEHFLYIAGAMVNIAGRGISLWDDEDEFYYDVIQGPHGEYIPLKVRSMVGLIPLFAVETLEPEVLDRLPEFKQRLEWFLGYRPDLASLVSHWDVEGMRRRRLLSLLRGHRMKRVLKRMLDETEFLSAYGVRSLSRIYRDRPYEFHTDGQVFTVRYQPAESDSALFGGNSNWRGPVWFPVNYLIIESLQQFHHYYGDDFRIEYPSGSGRTLSIREVAGELARRLGALFLRGDDGRRPAFGERRKLQEDPHFRDYLLFPEYFHGDTGAGLGASHQTGWTGLIATLLQSQVPKGDP